MTEARIGSTGIEVIVHTATGCLPVDRKIMAMTWSGPVTLKELHLGEPDPSQEELDQIADQIIPYSGVPPEVRVLQCPYLAPTVTVAPSQDNAA